MTLWTPTTLGSSLVAFFEADTLAVGTGNPVSSWVDQTSNAYTLVEATTANKPTLLTNDLNTHNTLQFDGTNDRLTIAGSFGITAQPISIFSLWTMANASQQVLLHSHNDGTNDPFAGIESSGLLQASVASAITSAITKAAWRGSSAVLSGASSSLAIDGNTRVTGTVGSGAPAGDKTAVGSLHQETGWFLNGKIAALLVLNAALSQANEDLLFGWGLWKYGLQANLPVGHPYKSAAPTISATGTRTVTAKLVRPDGSAWASGVVRFLPLSGDYRLSPDETVSGGMLEAVSDGTGAISVTLASGPSLRYKVILPDRSTFTVSVPDGSTVALETLR